jgi:hypothetical protein
MLVAGGIVTACGERRWRNPSTMPEYRAIRPAMGDVTHTVFWHYARLPKAVG